MDDLVHQRCCNHKYREAVARCPECSRFFCRECITEHGPTLLCAACLREEAFGETENRHSGSNLVARIAALRPILHLTAAIFVLWIAFFAVGKVLLAIPTEMHDARPSVWAFDQEDGP